jgi:hypothetical protein
LDARIAPSSSESNNHGLSAILGGFLGILVVIIGCKIGIYLSSCICRVVSSVTAGAICRVVVAWLFGQTIKERLETSLISSSIVFLALCTFLVDFDSWQVFDSGGSKSIDVLVIVDNFDIEIRVVVNQSFVDRLHCFAGTAPSGSVSYYEGLSAIFGSFDGIRVVVMCCKISIGFSSSITTSV